MNEIKNSITDEDIQKNKEKAEKYSSFLACFLLLGILLIFYFAYSFILGIDTLHWKETKAKIQLYNIKIETRKVESTTRRNLNRTTYTSVSGKLDYEYYVDGITYKNDRVSYLLTENDSMFRKLVLKGFENPISIKYDPNNPKNSVIYGFSFNKFWYLIAGGIIILISLIPIKFIRNNDNTFSMKGILIMNTVVSILIFTSFIGIELWLNLQ